MCVFLFCVWVSVCTQIDMDVSVYHSQGSIIMSLNPCKVAASGFCHGARVPAVTKANQWRGVIPLIIKVSSSRRMAMIKWFFFLKDFSMNHVHVVNIGYNLFLINLFLFCNAVASSQPPLVKDKSSAVHDMWIHMLSFLSTMTRHALVWMKD